MRLRRLVLSCQGNNAVAVTETLPTSSTTLAATTRALAPSYPVPDSGLRQILRGRHTRCGIIRLTAVAALHGGHHEHTHGCQERSPTPARYTPFTSPEGDRSLVSYARVLRSARCAPGQIRDASSCSGRGRLHHSRRSRLRIFPAGFLSGADSLSTTRLARLDPAASRTTSGSQTLRRCSGLRATTPDPKPSTTSCYSVRVDRGSVRPDRASTQPRTGTGTAAKKNALNLGACPANADNPWTGRYEDLRRQVQEEGSAPRSGGWGRALVIRRGLAAWMHAWPRHLTATLREPRAPAPPPLQEPHIPAVLRPQVTHILVNMILSTRSEVLS